MERAMLRKNLTKYFCSSWCKHVLKVTAGVLLVVALLPVEGKAYTDPGTGTFLLQMLLTGIAGTLFFMRALRHKIRLFFKRNKYSCAKEVGAGDNNQLNG